MSVELTKDDSVAQSSKEGSPVADGSLARPFRFVNNSATTMVNPIRPRMRPTFKAYGVVSNSQTSQLNQNSVIIEQTFDPHTANFVDSPNDVTSKYVFQMNIKRPPGRPRKHPIGEPKVKRPQGRPRKYPIEVSGSSVNKISKKPAGAISTSTGSSSTTDTTVLQGKKTTPSSHIPVDTALLDQSVADATTDIVVKRGRGRPKKETHQPLPTEDHDVATTVAAAAAAVNLLNPPGDDDANDK